MTIEFKFYVAGVQFHEAKQVIDEMMVGHGLVMQPEPDNKFDQNAVKLIFNEVMIGYVPGKLSADVSAFLDYGMDPIAKITKVDAKAKTWEQIEVVIKEYEEDEDA